jgi:hypothetical protein
LHCRPVCVRIIGVEPDDLRRVLFVTRRFHQLQGLRTMVFAVACVGAFWLQPYIRELRYAGPTEAFIGLLVSFAPFGAALCVPYVDRYYGRRFGTITATALDRARDIGLPLLVLLAGLWTDLRHGGQNVPSATLVAGTILALHIAVRDWPWRKPYFFVATACGLGAWLTAVVPSMRAETMQEFARISVSWLLATYAIAAYFDHRLLVTTMPLRAIDGVETASD